MSSAGLCVTKRQEGGTESTREQTEPGNAALSLQEAAHLSYTIHMSKDDSEEETCSGSGLECLRSLLHGGHHRGRHSWVLIKPPRLLGARGAPPRSRQPAPLSPRGQVSTLGQIPRINAEKPPGFLCSRRSWRRGQSSAGRHPTSAPRDLVSPLPLATGATRHSPSVTPSPQPPSRKEGKATTCRLIPPQISQLWLPRPLQGQDELRGPAQRQHFRTHSNALGKAAPRPPSTGSSPAEHIPPVGFSFSQTLNKTAAHRRCSCPWRGSGNHPGGLVERSQLPEPGRDFVLFKQHGDLRSRRIC